MNETLCGSEQMEVYKAACQKLGQFLDGESHGRVDSPKALKRSENISLNVRNYGEDSLLGVFRDVYLIGYPIIVKTLNALERSRVHTTQDLLGITPEFAYKKIPGCGKRTVVVVGLLQDIIRSQPEKVLNQ